MNLIRQNNPWNFFDQLQRELYMPATAKRSKRKNETEQANWTPSVDINESEKAFTLLADLPGVTPEKIDILSEKGVLTIKGERTIETVENTEKQPYLERQSGTFYRRFTLPESADTDAISAKSEHGVLIVNIPKQEVASARKIEVTH